jgi:hypothetical protein
MGSASGNLLIKRGGRGYTINQCNPPIHCYACPTLGPRFLRSYVHMPDDWRCEVIVRFVEKGGIVDHRFNFSFHNL